MEFSVGRIKKEENPKRPTNIGARLTEPLLRIETLALAHLQDHLLDLWMSFGPRPHCSAQILLSWFGPSSVRLEQVLISFGPSWGRLEHV